VAANGPVERARKPADVEAIRQLFREYAESLPFTLDFQGFDEELAGLPGAYGPPRGALFIARVEGRPVGCAGLRALDDTTCELKRLFVRPGRRGSGLGGQLTAAALAEARRLRYRRMRLDTVPGMEKAQALYQRLGFREIPPYADNPVPGTRFLELEL
jgi:GNAT superfamily N-acetyltransferase